MCVGGGGGGGTIEIKVHREEKKQTPCLLFIGMLQLDMKVGRGDVGLH